MRAVARKQRDSVARHHAVVADKMRADGSRAPREGRIIGVDPRSRQQCGRTGMQPRGFSQPLRNVHRENSGAPDYFAGSRTET